MNEFQRQKLGEAHEVLTESYVLLYEKGERHKAFVEVMEAATLISDALHSDEFPEATAEATGLSGEEEAA